MVKAEGVQGLSDREEEAPQEVPPAPSAANDPWTRALESLEVEFGQTVEEGRPRPKAPTPAAPAPVAGEAAAGAEAFLRMQSLQSEVERLRAELHAQEEAFDAYSGLTGDRYGLGTPSSAPPETDTDRARMRELESSLTSARRDSADRERIVEELRGQLDSLRGELRETREVLASSIPAVEEAPEREDGPASTGSPRTTPVPGPDEERSAPGVIVRHESGEDPEPPGAPPQAVPVEIYGPNDVALGTLVFAAGEGQALELFLSTMVIQWKALGHRFDARVAPDGIHVSLVGDPENRRFSVLSQGKYVIHMGALGADRVKTMLASFSTPKRTEKS